MTTTINLKRILDRKQWEMINPAPVASAAGSVIVPSSLSDQLSLYWQAATVVYLYDPAEDAFVQLPSPALSGTFGLGSAGEHHPSGPTGTASAGSASTITTTVTTVQQLPGYTIRITGGTGAGQERVISSNTIGTNAVFTVTSPWTTTPDATSTYLLLTGRFYLFMGGAGGSSMKYWDVATGAWSAALTVSGAPSAGTTEIQMVATSNGGTNPIASGTSTGTNSTTTLNNTGKAWTTNQWTNFQVRITSGTGAGQVRVISSNTATALTVSVVWTTTPDATSVYVIEGNDNNIYLLGNAAVTLYLYSISGNTWSTITPGVARAAAPSTGVTAEWVFRSVNINFNTENSVVNGKRIYSFRGGAVGTLDYYDIAANTWASGITYQNSGETFTTGTSITQGNDGIMYIQKDATGRWFKYDAALNALQPWSLLMYPQGAAIAGNKAWTVTFTDGASVIKWVYWLNNTQTFMFRQIVI